MKKQLLLALFIVAGLAAVFAFKQEHTPKKYLTLTFFPTNWITIVDELGVSQTTKLKGNGGYKADEWIEANQTHLTKKFNELSAKEYKLIAVSPTQGANHLFTTYIFEKE
jgi:hypothetical protein